MSNRTVVVTGASGTIGTALLVELDHQGFDIHGIDKSSNDWSDRIDEVTYRANLREIDITSVVPAPDVVVHLAATSRVGPTVERPETAVDNVVMTQRVLEYARQTNAAVVFASSREVYGEDTAAEPTLESTATIGSSQNPYAASKVSGEAFAQAYRRCYDVPVVILRYGNVYGRYDRSDRVVPMFIARALEGEPLEIYGGKKVLDFLHICDCIRGTVRAIERVSSIDGEAINIASGRGTTLVELADAVIEATGADVPVRRTDRRIGEVSRFVADISKAESLLDYEPTYRIKRGIAEAVEWYRRRPDVLDAVKNE